MKNQKFEDSKIYVEELGTFMIPINVAEEVLDTIFQDYGSQIDKALDLIQASLNLGVAVEKIEETIE